MATKKERRMKIKVGIRAKISGTPERPRLTVFRSNKQIYAQVIDDTTGRTLASASSLKICCKKNRITGRFGDGIPGDGCSSQFGRNLQFRACQLDGHRFVVRRFTAGQREEKA